MSAAHAPEPIALDPLLLPHPEPRRRDHIEIVPTRAQRVGRPKLVYPVAAVSGIGVILLAQLGLSLVTAQGSYEIAGLEAQRIESQRDVAALTEQQELLSSTQNVAQNAANLGMVSNSHRVYLRLSDGVVLGSPVAASAADGAVPGGNLVANGRLAGIAPVVPGAADAAGAAGAAAAGAAATADAPGAGASPAADAPAHVPSVAEVGTLPSPETR